MVAERKRSAKKTLRVTFPSGKVICYNNATSVMIDVLKEIGSQRFPEITLEMAHYPLLSQEDNPKFKGYIKPVCDGWFLNTQSNTDTKYIQVKAISTLLGINLKIEIGSDFETEDNPYKGQSTRSKMKLLVKLPDGEFIGNEKSTDTFLETIWHIGAEDICRKEIDWRGYPLITRYKRFDNQVQVDTALWITVPTTAKDMAKLLKIVAMYMHVNIEISLI